MTLTSLWRLYALRAACVLLVVELGIDLWPGLIDHEKARELMHGVACCPLAAVSILAAPAPASECPLQIL